MREEVADRQPDERRHHAQADRLEEEQLDELPWLDALHAQVGDHAPALGHGQQHRVERQQQPHDAADEGEEAGRLGVRSDRLLDEPHFLVGGSDGQSSGCQHSQLLANLSLPTGRGRDDDTGDPSREARDLLDEGERGDRGHRAREATERFRAQDRDDSRGAGAPAQLDGHPPGGAAGRLRGVS